MRASNPLAFGLWPVTIIASLFYIAFAAVLLYVGLTVPPAPKSDVPVQGLNLAEALQDLRELSNAFHPYNSRRSDEVRTWLLSRVASILEGNAVDYATVRQNYSRSATKRSVAPGSAAAVIFDDLSSNTSFSTPSTTSGSPALSVYFEGTNIIVYCRGEKDASGAWWEGSQAYEGQKGVLVNAHYDSVSTGYGATDDGVGVITILQLLQYFTRTGNQPRHGIVFLLNNGEEDFLNGARAFSQHPASKFPDRFLNLEGAGAGGRAALFRSTDAEVTRFYQRAKYPFATSTSADGFKAGLVKSETDYRVFYGDLQMHGLDISFMEPRSKYHTVEDDARHSGRDSIWHMLSAALPTLQGLAESDFDAHANTDAAWFDLFGLVFAVLELHTLFALQVTLLVVAPVSTFVFMIILQRQDKLYLFTRYRQVGDSRAPIGGLRGILRAPIIFAISSAASVAVAFLLIKLNPFVTSSSPWSVWASFVSVWIFVAWFLSRLADFARPSALHRAYTLIWLHVGSWALAVAAVVYEVRGLTGGYLILFYELGFWLASLVAIFELFALPKKASFAASQIGQSDGAAGDIPNAGEASCPHPHQREDEPSEQEEPTERTALLGEQGTSFGRGYRRSDNTSSASQREPDHDSKPSNVYEHEQLWSGKLPSTLWVLEFLLAATPALMFFGPMITFVTTSLTQTLSDGGGFGIYITMAVLSILVVAPIQPFIHRFTFHVPLFLLLVFAGTLSYNLFAFPFSHNNRLKIFFIQQVDLDTGLQNVVLAGAEKHLLEEAANSLPSTSGKLLNMTSGIRPGLVGITWPGLPPTVVPNHAYEDWLNVNVTRTNASSGHEAIITVAGRNTRNCKLLFNSPVKSFYVEGSASDNGPYKGVPETGTSEIRLWHRTWETPWTVKVAWNGQGAMEGRALCGWNEDEKQPSGGIPALREVRQFAPTWIAVTKVSDGLVEGSKKFKV